MAFLSDDKRLVIRQKKELMEMFVDFETRNKYEIYTAQRRLVGYMAEMGKGVGETLIRMFLGSHRPLHIQVFDPERRPLLTLERPFYWFFSTMTVVDTGGRKVGEIHKKFAWFRKIYDLHDSSGRIFAHIRSNIFSLWRFPFFDVGDREVGEVTKKWGGGLKELFTDADTFLVDMSKSNFSDDQQMIAFAAAVSVDLDYFEGNSGSAINLIGD